MDQTTQPQVNIQPKPKEVEHHAYLNDEGGIKLEIESDANFLSTTKDLMVDLGSKVFKGSLDFSEISLPISMLSEYTRLEIISFEYPHLSLFLSKAAQAQDPVERMKLITAGYVFADLTQGCQRDQLYHDTERAASDPCFPRREARGSRSRRKPNPSHS